jgi:hypothetical protein
MRVAAGDFGFLMGFAIRQNAAVSRGLYAQLSGPPRELRHNMLLGRLSYLDH